MPDVAIPKGFRYAILAPAFKRGARLLPPALRATPLINAGGKIAPLNNHLPYKGGRFVNRPYGGF